MFTIGVHDCNRFVAVAVAVASLAVATVVVVVRRGLLRFSV